jgi:Mrp family chromosome partitioning ATPase
MSRNFELLQRAEEEWRQSKAERVIFESETGAATKNARRPPSSESMIKCKQPIAALPALAREELVKFIQRLFWSPGSKAPQVVVLSGLEPQNGSSWVATCASEVLAACVDGSVCLVDANLCCPSVHEHFGVTNHHGFTDAVLGSGPLRQFTNRLSRNLWLLTSGSVSADNNPLLTSDRLRSRFQELRAEFDYVLVESAAAALNTDAMVLGQLADGMVLVLEAHATRRDVAQNVKEDLVRANVRMLGTVLNNRTFPVPQTLYSRL